MKLVYSQGNGSITNDTGTWAITQAPKLSFSFDGIFFDVEKRVFYKYVGQGRNPLTDSEITELKSYVSAQVLVPPPAPTAADIALAAQVTADQSAISVGKADSVIQFLVTHTPAECEAYVQANVNTLAQAKTLLGKFAIALCVLSKSTLR